MNVLEQLFVVVFAGAGLADVVKNRSIAAPIRFFVKSYCGPGSEALADLISCASCLGFWTGCLVAAVFTGFSVPSLSGSLTPVSWLLAGLCSSAASTALEALVKSQQQQREKKW